MLYRIIYLFINMNEEKSTTKKDNFIVVKPCDTTVNEKRINIKIDDWNSIIPDNSKTS